jgi:hypothetical protein
VRLNELLATPCGDSGGPERVRETLGEVCALVDRSPA